MASPSPHPERGPEEGVGVVHHWGITMGNAGWGWMGSEYNNKILLTVETDAHNQSLDGEYQQTIALETEIQMRNVPETKQ